MARAVAALLGVILLAVAASGSPAVEPASREFPAEFALGAEPRAELFEALTTDREAPPATPETGQPPSDGWSTLFVFVLATFIGIGVIGRVSRLLHTPLMSLTNAISAIAVVGSIIVAGGDYPVPIRVLGAVALFASMTNIVSGFLITNRMLKMFKQQPRAGDKR
jgi:H+-translocating NAD(P) transhydrogenase subunit alpha